MGWLRHPKTAQELRRAYGDEAERRYDEVPAVRSKRSGRRLPSAWDDIKNIQNRRCWKKYRKTQWREKRRKKTRKSKFRGHLHPKKCCNLSRWHRYWNKQLNSYEFWRKVVFYYEGRPESKRILIFDTADKKPIKQYEQHGFETTNYHFWHYWWE